MSGNYHRNNPRESRETLCADFPRRVQWCRNALYIITFFELRVALAVAFAIAINTSRGTLLQRELPVLIRPKWRLVIKFRVLSVRATVSLSVRAFW